MLRIVLPILLVCAVPWGLLTWWRMRRARSLRERQFIERTHTGLALFVGLGVLVLALLQGREQFFALPILFVAGLGLRHGIRKGRARLQAEESDPLSRAKRIN